MDERAAAAQKQISVQLQRRADLVPNLVNTVKGFAAQEAEVFETVAKARAGLAGAVSGGNVTEMANANQKLTGALGRLLAISENYPQLKSDQNFLRLQDELTGTENRIAVARTDYNRRRAGVQRVHPAIPGRDDGESDRRQAARLFRRHESGGARSTHGGLHEEAVMPQ